MPTLTLSIAMICKYTRQVRAVVLEELNKDYVIAAYARGIGYKTVLFKSVFRCSIMTIITLLTLSIASLLGGTAIVETIFMWDGVGKLAVDAITMRDYPMIQAYVAWMAVIYVLINLITGRTHQIRVQMAGKKAGIWGDTKYNPKFRKTKKSYKQIGLHASRLEFEHPVTGEHMVFKNEPEGKAFEIIELDEF